MRVNPIVPRRLSLMLVLVLLGQVSLSAQQKPDCIVRVTLLQVNDVYQFAPVELGYTRRLRPE